jgi:hypothetical protein
MSLEERIAAIEARQRAHGQHDPDCPQHHFLTWRPNTPSYEVDEQPEDACNCWLSKP